VNGVLVGPPGTGKTTAGILIARDWIESGVLQDEVAYLSFTKAAAREAAGRIVDSNDPEAERFPYFRTIHSLAYMGLRLARQDLRVITTSDMKKFSKETGYDGVYSVHEWEDIADVLNGMQNSGKTEYDKSMAAYTLTRVLAKSESDINKARLHPASFACRSIGVDDPDVYRAFVKKYEKFKAENGVIDFTDMLEFALLKMPAMDKVERVVIDEAQDLCPLHHEIIRKLFAPSKETWWIGDDDQCQPGSTMVTMEDGSSKPIKDVRKGDRVLSWDQKSQYTLKREVSDVASRLYSGRMIGVSAGTERTEATPNHKFVIRWVNSARFGKTCVTYLMRRGSRWRVGWCQLFNSDGALHLNIRANVERADAVWILGVHKNRTDASVHESVVAASYGLPTVPFRPVNGATHITEESIERIFCEIGDRTDSAIRCLEDHGRDVKWPLIDKVSEKGRHRSTIMEVRACNLIPEMMMVPLPGSSYKDTEWDVIQLDVKDVQKVRVFSLDVERSHTYIANGIITHNCIYRFSGAAPHLFLDRIRTADHRILLRQTHRFGQEIVDFSAKIIRRVKDRVDKEIIGVADRDGFPVSVGGFSPVAGNVLILHRHIAGCQAVAKLYMDAGIPFRNERGKDPLNAPNRLKGWRAIDELSRGMSVHAGLVKTMLDELVPSTANMDGEERRLVVHGAKKKMETFTFERSSLEDLVQIEVLTAAGASAIKNRLYQVMRHGDDLKFYDRVTKNGYSLDGQNVAKITTIHGSKGRQADEVVVFSEMSNRCWQDDQTEHRLAYVAATRTRGNLQVCSERTVDWARTQYNYPLKETARDFV